MTDSTLTAGVARVDITPPVGFRLQGAMRRTEGSVGVESPLLATALVLADEDTTIVLIDCDLIGFDRPLAAQIRQEIGDRVDTPASHVIVGCTHTHNGPCTARTALGGVHDVGGDPDERAQLDAYIQNLKGQLAGIAAEADDNRVPARVGAGRGEAGIAINREEKTADGRVLVGRNPEGATDHAVDVLRVDDVDGNPLAVLVGYAAHPVTMGFHTHHISQDFPGVVRDVVEQVTGATCLYLTGAAGNQALLSFLQNDWGERERMGGVVGAAALQAFFEIETRPHEVVREEGTSLSSIALYEKAFSEGPTHRLFKVASRQATVPLQPLPTLEEAEQQLAEARTRVQELERDGAPKSEVYPARLVERWAAGVADKVRSGLEREELSFDVIAVRIDDIAIVAMPGEPFVEIGLGVKERSKAAHTLFAGYCNGVIAYWPTAATVRQGGMAVDAALKSYDISAPPVPEAVDLITGFCAEALAEVGL